MKDGWEIKKLKDLAVVINGGTPDTKISEYWDGGVLWITPKDMGQLTSKYVSATSRTISEIGLEKSSAKLIPNNSLILSTRAPIGYLAINTCAISTNQGCKGIVPSENLSSEYLYYFFSKSVKMLIDLGNGTTFKELSTSSLKNIDIPLPPLSEQKEIVVLLDDVLSRIDKARENIEKNIENAKELYENTVEKIFAEFEEEYRCVRLSDVCHYDKIKNTSPNLPYVGLEHIESNTGKFLGELTPTEVLSSTFHFSDTHLLYGRLRPYLNKALLPTFEGHCSTEIFPISVHEEITREYLFYWITKKSIVKRIDETWTGARMPRANMTQVLEFEIPLPPLSKQQEIVSTLGKLRDDTELVKTIYTKKLQALDELRNSVLEKAFRGELT